MRRIPCCNSARRSTHGAPNAASRSGAWRRSGSTSGLLSLTAWQLHTARVGVDISRTVGRLLAVALLSLPCLAVALLSLPCLAVVLHCFSHSVETLQGRPRQPAQGRFCAHACSCGRRPQAHTVRSCPPGVSAGDLLGIGAGSTDYCGTDDEHQVASLLRRHGSSSRQHRHRQHHHHSHKHHHHRQ